MNRFAILAAVLVAACSGSATNSLSDLEARAEAESNGLSYASVSDETAGRAPRGDEQAADSVQASDVREIGCSSCIARDSWASEDLLHRELSEADRACGLHGNVLDFNTLNDPEVDFEVLACLERQGSHRTAWKAFLYAVQLSESSQTSCQAVRAADIALRTSNVAKISTFGLEPERFQGNPLVPFSERYRLVTLRDAVMLYFNGEGADVSGFVGALNDCEEDLRGIGVVYPLPVLVTFFEGGQ